MEFYQKTLETIYNDLHTSRDGIAASSALKRLKTHGENKIAESEPTSLLKIFISQFTSPLIVILLIAMGITYYFQEYKDTIVIGVAVLSNAIIGFIQEMNAERSMQALKNLLVPQALVIRDGVDVSIKATKLVPGDIVILSSGTSVPADLRLCEVVDLAIDESTLTGESLPVQKHSHVLSHPDLTPGDQVNMAFMGTSVVRGRGLGIVVATGDKTVLGMIARQVATVKKTITPLQEKMNRFARLVVGIVLFGITSIFLTGLLKGTPTSRLFFDVVAVAVASVPEGLPIVVTVAMAIGVQRMARKNTIIRTLPSVETLGSTTVICSDKTGTLTRNEMTVKKVYDGKDVYDIHGEGYSSHGNIALGDKVIKHPHDGLLHLLQIGALCNETHIAKKGEKYEIHGDPTEAALIVSAAKEGFNHEKLIRDHKQEAILPFESGRNYMATLNHMNGKKYLFVKGSHEVVAKLCSSSENTNKETYMKTAESFGREGLRVLAMAYKQVEDSFIFEEHHIKGLKLCGLQAIMDPPRAEAVAAIKGCQEAGIRVVMITGDHAVTAHAIGNMLGICDKHSNVLSGEQIKKMSETDLFNKVQETSVFARVAPEQKLQIVHQLMKHGEIVAVTGDGVNDAPALKAAHLGIAMGKSGTDVAREAANMIIRNDNFHSIFLAVYEGRVVFENIRKAVAFLIPVGFAAIICVLTSMIINVPSPFLAVQLLWINLVASGIQDVALAFEPGDRHILKQLPRSPKEGIMSTTLIWRSVLVSLIISVGIIFIYLLSLERGADLKLARTMAVTTMVFFQFFQVLNARSEKESIFRMDPFSNKFLFIGLIGSLVSHLAVMYIPALESFFSMTPLSLMQWILILVTASTVIALVELHKAVILHNEQKAKRTANKVVPV